MSGDMMMVTVGGVMMLVAVWFAMAYNRLIVLSKRCDEAFADIDVYMKQRHDLVPNLVEVVKTFASHERGIIDSVTSARRAATVATTDAQKQKAETLLGAALTQVVAASESYPQIAASSHFVRLKDEISDCEHKIAASRRYLNMAVREYNATLEQMPANLIAGIAGMQTREFYDLGLGRVLYDEAPAVKF